MPGYKETGALASLGAASPSPEMDAFRQRQMQNAMGAAIAPNEQYRELRPRQPNSIGESINPNAMSVMNERYGAAIAPNEQPKYTAENLQLMMQQPEMISIMEEMSANSGVPMEDVIRYLPELPQDTLEMIMNDVFEAMKKR